MEDLSSVDWAPSKGSAYQGQGPKGNYFATLKPSPPVSGRSTPSNVIATGLSQKPMSSSNTGSKASTPVNDSFAGLVSFNSSQATKNLSLQEQQRMIQERKAKAEEERRRQFDSHFGGSQQTSLSSNFSKTSTPVGGISPPAYTGTQQSDGVSLSKLINKPFAAIPNGSISSPSPENDEDLLAAFSSSAPVDKSSHMPPVQDFNRAQLNSLSDLGPSAPTSDNGADEDILNDDDDPFGLGVQAPANRPTLKPLVEQQDDDDVLGLLGRPVSEFPKPEPPEAKPSPSMPASPSDPLDRATAELVDMGFSAEHSRQALETTESGSDVQAAVGWLLNQAHEDSRKEKQKHVSSRPSPSKGHSARREATRRKSSGSGSSRPAWMKGEGQSGPSSHRRDSRSPAKGEKDPAQLAQELGNNLFKTANSLWKTGTKKLNQAVAEFNAEGGTDQPKWMREANGETHGHKQRTGQHGEEELARRHQSSSGHSSRTGPPAAESKVTNEALLLESGDGRPQRKVPRRPATRPDASDQSDLPNRPQETRQQRPAIPQETSAKDPRRKLSRQAVEDEAAQAYVSPARRRKAVAKPASSSSPPPPPPPAQPEPDLLLGSEQNAPPNVQPRQRPTPTAPVRPLPSAKAPSAKAPTITRASAPKRNIPPISPSAIQQSTSSRKLGTEAFKRGDYAGATILYDRSLSALPPTHPLTLPVLTNRALSHLKTGDPKACISDAKTAIDLIGPSRGSNETIDLGSGEGNKPMADYWGKAMMRQAEALEQLERWIDAATSWKACVEAGLGGSASIAARNRCENAAKPKPAASAVKRPPPRPKPTPSALNDLAPTSIHSAEAVTRLREANAAADKVDDEKFKLADQVDARILKWRAGKEGNLRALLSSLETVLWADAGWKKVGMGDVLLPGKVKVVYMRGIAKVHPDKLPTTATTEQKMISAAVFATLNEAWERFRQENGL